MNTKQLTYPSIESQEQFWIDKEAQSDNATNGTLEELERTNVELGNYLKLAATIDKLTAALEDVELRATQDKLACGIGKRKNQTAFLLGALERIRNAARAAIDASRLNKPESTTADPEPKPIIKALLNASESFHDLSRTEATTDWYDHYEVERNNFDRGDLRDEGRNPDGSGESYAERNH